MMASRNRSEDHHLTQSDRHKSERIFLVLSENSVYQKRNLYFGPLSKSKVTNSGDKTTFRLLALSLRDRNI